MEVEENFMQSLSGFFIVFGDTVISSKRSLDLYFHSSIIEFRIEEKIHTKGVADVSRNAVGRVFLFSWEMLEGG